MHNTDVRLARICDVICAETGLVDVWTAEGPTIKALTLRQSRSHQLSGDQKLMFLFAWALWNGAGCITVWALIHRLKAHLLFTVGEVLQALAGGSYAMEAWLAKRKTSDTFRARKPRARSTRAAPLSRRSKLSGANTPPTRQHRDSRGTRNALH